MNDLSKLMKPNEKLDHLCRFLNSVRGTDKVLMVRDRHLQRDLLKMR